MRKILSFLMISLMAVSLSAKTIYLNTGGASLWNQADAVFFAHSWGSEDSDVLMTLVEGDVFSAEIPDGNTSVVFVRMAPGSEAINWDTKWNQSTDQQIPNDQNCFTMTDWSNGTWSVYAPAGAVADFTQPFTLKFNGTGESGKDASAAFAANVAAIFDAASAPYVASVETATKVYAGRPIADDNSSVKFGTSSAQGTLAFTLAQAIEVDSIIVNATQYGNNAAKVTVNGVEFDLTAGNKVPQDSKITPEGEVTTITIAQSGTERIYLRNVRIYPKAGDTPQPPVVETPKFYITGNAALVGAELQWNPAAIPSMEDSKVLALEAGSYMMKVTKKGNWDEGVLGYDALTGEIPAGVTRGEGGDNDNICFTLAEAGDVTVTYTAESFTLAGNFYVAPVEPTAKFYVTGNAALVGQELEWNPAAIPSMNDTLVLNLDADVDYILKVAVNGTWEGENNVKGYNELTDKTAGLLDISNDHNIGFKLNEAGEVKVVYIAAAEEQPEVFKVIGDFYVAPVEPTAKFYVTGNAALVGQELEWNPAAIPSMNDTLVLNLDADVDYILKVAVNGTWEGENNVKGYNELTDKTAGLLDISNDHNIGFKLNEAGEVKVVYIAAAEEQPEVFKVIGDFYVAPVEPTAKFYVTGDSALVVDAGLEAEKAWAPQAIRVDADTMVLNLNAEQEYKLKITLNGEWETGKGYSSLTETPNGLTTDGDDNIIFTLAEAGEVKVVYIAAAEEQEEIFKVIGNFYVAPEPVKQYMLYGEAAIANGEDWNENSDINVMTTTDEGLTYTLTVEGVRVQGPHTFEFKIIEKGNNQIEYYPRQYGANAGLYIEESGIYTITFIYTVATQNCVADLQKTGDLEPGLENGYYLVGTMNDWTPAAENLFEQNPDNEAEYKLAIDLEVNDEIKVVYVENDAIVTWYPNEGGNYVIDDHHNGETTMYFRPDYQGGDDWFAACIYVAPTSTVDITNIDANVEAVKVLRDAQILIIKGEKVYNVMGQTIK